MTINDPVPPGGGPLLSVRDLRVSFPLGSARFAAVDGVSFDVARGETLGIVGESGSGKSMTALSLMRLVAAPGRTDSGEVLFDGRDLVRQPAAVLRGIRGREIAMIFQEPMTSLNPLFAVGSQIGESLRIHEGLSGRQARTRAIDLLDLVGIPAPARCADEYPHQLSGGMRQRVMIAIALACRPRLLIADEPTTALDVTVQAQILDLLMRLKEEFRMALILITHAMGVIARVADRVAVMYAGRIIEEAPVRALFARPDHPYTAGLLACIPRIEEEKVFLDAIEGSVPPPGRMPSGCRFEPRCARAHDICQRFSPQLIDAGAGRKAACFALTGFLPPASAEPGARPAQ